ncbi:DUF6538 domain-containing protein [Sphingomonas sp.]|uniref:DUF6538 domain-containing protein n=1 Tax=Sphingomonas sp. TaxID=28214 RepID=UPI00343392C0
MGVAVEYVRRLKSGRLEYRRAFPAELRPFVGSRELIRSLKTKSMTAPRALESYHAANADYERSATLARKALDGAYDDLDAPRIAWLAQDYTSSFLAEDDARRVLGTADPDSHQAADDGLRETLIGRSPEFIRGMLQKDAEELAAKHGLRLDTESVPFLALCRELLQAMIRANEIRIARDEGEPVPTPAPPSGPKAPPGPPRKAPTQATFVTLALLELKRPTGVGASTKQASQTALNLFKSAMGDLSPQEISRAKVTEFADLLACLPAKRSVAEKHRQVREVVKSSEGHDAPRLSWKTRATHLGSLSALWNKLISSGQIDPGKINPFARHNIGKAPAPIVNPGFSAEELRRIFALPVFATGERPSGCRGEAAYWVPLVLLTTGARPEEIAQLLVGDLKEGGEGFGWTLTITDAGVHPHKGKQRLKTPGAGRTFPVPQSLLDLGFLRYVGWLKAHGETALFPTLRTRGARGLLFPSFGEWWSRYLKTHAANPEGRRAGREFRHTWPTAARECEVSREAQEYIMGHYMGGGTSNASYGDRRSLGGEIHKVAFKGFSLANVAPWDEPERQD